MKLKSAAAVLALFFGAAVPTAQATSYYWGASGISPAAGATGTWDATSSLWFNGSTTGTLGVWPNTSVNTDAAQLAGTAGTLTLNSSSVNINVNKITFGTTGYMIAAPGAGTATLNLSGTTPTIDTGASPNSQTIGAKITGTAGLTKSGTGTLTLSGTNTYTGTTTVTAGTLTLTAIAAQPASGTLAISSGASVKLSLSTGATAWPATTVSGLGTLVATPGSTSSDGIVLSNYNLSGFTGVLDVTANGGGKMHFGSAAVVANTSATLRVESGATAYYGYLSTGVSFGWNVELLGAGSTEGYGALRLDNNYRQNGPVLLKGNSSIGGNGGLSYVGGVISESGGSYGFTKLNTSTLVLTKVNTYSGATIISGGKLVGVTGGSCANSAVTINNTAGYVLGVKVATSDGQWTCSSLTSAGTNAGLEFGFSVAPSTTTAPLNITGNCTFTTGAPGITLDAANLTAGTYPLIVVSGTAPSTTPAVTITGAAGTMAATTAWGGTDNKTLSVTITGSSYEPLTWNTGSGTWDINTTANWKNNTGATAIKYQDAGLMGDQVQFTDSGLSAATTVTLNTTVNPGSVTANHSTYDYTISGSGGIAGSTGLTKAGTGKLTLSGVNTYTGGTVVSGGTLTLTALAAQPASSTLAISSGATVNLSASVDGNWPTTTVTGAGTLNANPAASKYVGLNNYNMSGFTGILDITATSGICKGAFSPTFTMNNNATIKVENGTTAYYGYQGLILACNVELYGAGNTEGYGALRLEANCRQNGPVLLKGNSSIGGNGGTGYVGGVISDGSLGYGFTKLSTSTLVLTNANTYSGATTVSAGTLKLDTGGTLANTPNITVASGAGFDVSTPTAALTLGDGQTLKASATGGNTTATITLASSKNLTLGGTSTGLAFTALGSANTTAPLTVAGTGGSLDLAGKPVTVTTTTALAIGIYKLIAKSGSATVTGTPGTLTIGGSGLASGTTGTLRVTSGELVLNVSASSPYRIWADTYLPGSDVSNPDGDNDGDFFTNFWEYAFGTNPTVSYTGEIVYVNGGAVTTPGQPKLLIDRGNYYAVFGRRTDCVAAGLTYTVQFSADLGQWTSSATGLTVLTDGLGVIDAVQVPFPDFVGTPSVPKKPQFFRVMVSN